MKKVIIAIFSCLVFLGFPVAVSADINGELVVPFNEITFTVENYRVENPEIFYTKRGLTEVATVIDSNTGEVVETIELVPNLTRATVRSHTLRRSSNFGGVTLQLSVNIELYSNGSFRQINSV